MKAMEIDSSNWTDEMRLNAVRKLEELGYKRSKVNYRLIYSNTGLKSIWLFEHGVYSLYDKIEVPSAVASPTYEQLMAITKEDVA